MGYSILLTICMINMSPKRRKRNGLELKTLVKLMLFNTFCAAVLVKGHNQGMETTAPEFLAPLANLTGISQGRDVTFTCVVDNLGPYRVAWIKSDSKAILAIHTHMVALNPRLSVTHNGHNTWKLHISHVQLNDSGSYMCQVNTDPMKSQSAYLDVVVPPDILNQPDTSSGVLDGRISNEGGTVQLVCRATGVPEPTVQWRREGGKDIILRHDAREKQVVKLVEGEKLVLHHVHRTDMGGYLCIASNGVPPSVSKHFDVQVNFPPSVKAVNQLVGAPIESQVVLQCIVEASPRAMNDWYKNEGSIKLHDGTKYIVSEALLNSYTWQWQMNLTISNLQKSDFGTYTCSSSSSLGKSDARIRLQELRLPPKPTTTPTPYVHTTVKPRRKQQTVNYKILNEVVRVKDTPITNNMQENDIVGNLPEVHTQLPARSGYEKGGYEKSRNTQTPAVVPSQQPSWILHSGTQMRFCDNFAATSVVTSLFLLFVFKHILNEIVLT